MILTDIDIQDRVCNKVKYTNVYEMDKFKVEAVPLIEPFDEKQLESASYDLKITDKITRFKDEYKKISLDNKIEIDSCCEEISIKSTYALRPGEYILVKLRETINMPNDLIAHIRPRTSLTKIGVLLSPQHLNPSYCGALSLGLQNVSPYVIEITPNLSIGQIVFEELTQIPTKERLYINKINAKYQNERDFVGSKIYDEIDKKVQEEYEKILKSIRGE